MHGSVRNDLESLLAGKANMNELGQHLSSCAECSGELAAMQEQNGLFQSLRSTEELEPSAGFYARVMQRIEEKAKDSIWAVFVYSPFGKRLALASFSFAILMSSYVVAEEKFDGHLLTEKSVAVAHYDAPMEGSQAQQRDAVLENFAEHEGGAR